jgi:hypothetical protein
MKSVSQPRREIKKLNPEGLSLKACLKRPINDESTMPPCSRRANEKYDSRQASWLVKKISLTVAAQRWTFTSFHLLSPDIRASGHLEICY